MHETSTPQRTSWQLAALWVVGVSGAVVLSSAVVLSAAGRVTDPVTTFRLAAGADGVTTASDAMQAAKAPAMAERWPDLESFRIALATGSLLERSAPLSGSWTDPSTLGPMMDGDTTTEPDGSGDLTLPTDEQDGDVTPPSGGSEGGGGSDGDRPDASNPGKTISTQAGTVRVKVEDDRVQVVYATPGDGYAVTIEGDGTKDVQIQLTSKGGRTRINAGVEGGSPTLTVEQDGESTEPATPLAPVGTLDSD